MSPLRTFQSAFRGPRAAAAGLAGCLLLLPALARAQCRIEVVGPESSLWQQAASLLGGEASGHAVASRCSAVLVEAADGQDDDCDGLIDEGTTLYDDDGDGASEAAGDCDDTDAAVRPLAAEKENGVDDDCDGAIDEGTASGDDDGDGFTEVGGDCDDGDASVNPGAREAEDGIDNNCDGATK